MKKSVFFRSVWILFFLTTMGILATTHRAMAQEADGAQEAYQAPALIQSDGWTMAVLSDPQSYVKFSRNQGIFELMTAWLAENLGTLNIQQILCVGDLVEANGLLELTHIKPNVLNQTSAQMWSATARAFERLDGKIPYVVCTGNHDHGYVSAESRDTQFPKYFPVSKNPAWKDVLVDMDVDEHGEKTLANAAYEFTAPGGQKILTLSLQFAPTDANIAWAKKLISSEEYANHFVILLTHAYMHSGKSNNAHITEERGKRAYVLHQQGGNAGEQIWQKLVFPSKNIRMVICGHVSSIDSFEGSNGFRVDPNESGRPVYQMMFDTQAMGGGWNGNGGDGWIRLLEFSKDMKTVHVRTFSPLFAISPTTQKLAWAREKINEFTFSLE